MTRRPLILMSPDFELRSGRRGETPYFFMEASYGTAVWAAGGYPLFAPYSNDHAAIAGLLEQVHGLVLTGGDFDIDPELFDEEPHPALGTVKRNRTDFERALYEGAVQRQLPILGICGGMQLINVLRGGTLWQDLGSQCEAAMQHEQDGSKDVPGHEVTIKEQSGLHNRFQQTSIGVNSTHHQAIKTLGANLCATAIAPDGIIEAFEATSGSFLWGVQWHPEAMAHMEHRPVYDALIDAAREYMNAMEHNKDNGAESD